jgi:dTDP-4-dehydrorhamnose 3,5-epimerase
MTFEETSIAGAFVIRPEPVSDERGFFARTYSHEEFRRRGLDPVFVLQGLSHNRKCGTLRGMHLQLPPHAENKLVACNRGAIYDVVLDLRPDSPSYRRWFGADLTARGLESMFIPKGCAHGFITLEDETVVHYDISAAHTPELARGYRYDDPAFQIVWPMAPVVVSKRDLAYPLFGPATS